MKAEEKEVIESFRDLILRGETLYVKKKKEIINEFIMESSKEDEMKREVLLALLSK